MARSVSLGSLGTQIVKDHIKKVHTSYQRDKRDKYLRKTYGISSAVYRRVLKLQNGVCAICQRRPRKNQRFHVDHDHKTDRVRGILCWVCNHRFLGRRRENPDHHRRAYEYLVSDFDARDLMVQPKTSSGLRSRKVEVRKARAQASLGSDPSSLQRQRLRIH